MELPPGFTVKKKADKAPLALPPGFKVLEKPSFPMSEYGPEPTAADNVKSALGLLPIAGGVGGTIFGGPAGGVVAATLGSAAKVAGEEFMDASGMTVGQPRTPLQAGGEPVLTGAVDAAFGFGLPPAVKFARTNIAGPIWDKTTSIAARLFGVGKEAAERGASRPDKVFSYASMHSGAEQEGVNALQEATEKYVKNAKGEYVLARNAAMAPKMRPATVAEQEAFYAKSLPKRTALQKEIATLEKSAGGPLQGPMRGPKDVRASTRVREAGKTRLEAARAELETLEKGIGEGVPEQQTKFNLQKGVGGKAAEIRDDFGYGSLMEGAPKDEAKTFNNFWKDLNTLTEADPPKVLEFERNLNAAIMNERKIPPSYPGGKPGYTRLGASLLKLRGAFDEHVGEKLGLTEMRKGYAQAMGIDDSTRKLFKLNNLPYRIRQAAGGRSRDALTLDAVSQKVPGAEEALGRIHDTNAAREFFPTVPTPWSMGIPKMGRAAIAGLMRGGQLMGSGLESLSPYAGAYGAKKGTEWSKKIP